MSLEGRWQALGGYPGKLRCHSFISPSLRTHLKIPSHLKSQFLTYFCLSTKKKVFDDVRKIFGLKNSDKSQNTVYPEIQKKK